MGGKSLRKCEVCGIRRVSKRYSEIFLARFPLDPIRCRLWVKLTGNEDLAYLPIQRLNENKFICGKHFAKSAFNKKGNRLERNAIPSLNLNKPLSDEILSSFPITDYILQHEKLETELNNQPSHRSDHNYLKQHLSDHSYHASSQKVTVSVAGNDQNGNNITETDNIEGAIDDEGTDPELGGLAVGPFTWQKQAITCADDENTNVVGDEPESIHKCNGAQKEQAMIVDLDTVVECEEEGLEHGGYRCNECAGDIIGSRYACVQCADYDVCAACEARGKHAHHYALRVPSLKPRDEVQRIIETIQKCINDDPSLIFLPVDDSVKIEVKNEDEDQPNETDCESDPLMVPTVQSLREGEIIRQVPVLEQDPLHSSNAEQTDYTARGQLSYDIQDEHFNQQFILNPSSVPDTGQDCCEVYYLISKDLKSETITETVSTEHVLTRHLEVDDRNSLVDDINDPTNSVEESDRQNTLVLLSNTTQDVKSNVKLKLNNATNYLTRDLSDLMCIKSKNLLVKLDRLDMTKLGLFSGRRRKNIKR